MGESANGRTPGGSGAGAGADGAGGGADAGRGRAGATGSGADGTGADGTGADGTGAGNTARRPLQVDRAVEHHAGHAVATVDASIVIISLPAIFRGINLDPLTPGNVGYLLWMLMGYLVVSAVLVVTSAASATSTAACACTTSVSLSSRSARSRSRSTRSRVRRGAVADRLRVSRHRRGHADGQLPGDPDRRLPANQRGMAMGINRWPASPGSFIGLIVGGVLAAINWRLVFMVEVPFGIGGTIWSYLSLREIGIRTAARDRLARQRDLRRRTDRAARRHHLRHPAVRRARRWAGPARSCSQVCRRRRPARRLLLRRTRVDQPDVRSEAAPDPRVRRRATPPRCSPRSPAAACSSC